LSTLGAPLNAKKLVTAQGVEDFTDATVAYAIVEVGSHDEAVRVFSEHPHLELFPGKLHQHDVMVRGS
jgi:hypothetical protein